MDDQWAIVNDFLESKFGCSACPLRFSSQPEFERHRCPPRIKCNGYIRKKCDEAPFNTAEEFEAHFRVVHYKNHACHICMVRFDTEEKIMAHMKNRHIEEKPRSEAGRTWVVREDRTATPPTAAAAPSTSAAARPTPAAAATPSCSTGFRPNPAAAAPLIPVPTCATSVPSTSTSAAPHTTATTSSTSARLRQNSAAAAPSTTPITAAPTPKYPYARNYYVPPPRPSYVPSTNPIPSTSTAVPTFHQSASLPYASTSVAPPPSHPGHARAAAASTTPLDPVVAQILAASTRQPPCAASPTFPGTTQFVAAPTILQSKPLCAAAQLPSTSSAHPQQNQVLRTPTSQTSSTSAAPVQPPPAAVGYTPAAAAMLTFNQYLGVGCPGVAQAPPAPIRQSLGAVESMPSTSAASVQPPQPILDPMTSLRQLFSIAPLRRKQSPTTRSSPNAQVVSLHPTPTDSTPSTSTTTAPEARKSTAAVVDPFPHLSLVLQSHAATARSIPSPAATDPTPSPSTTTASDARQSPTAAIPIPSSSASTTAAPNPTPPAQETRPSPSPPTTTANPPLPTQSAQPAPMSAAPTIAAAALPPPPSAPIAPPPPLPAATAPAAVSSDVAAAAAAVATSAASSRSATPSTCSSSEACRSRAASIASTASTRSSTPAAEDGMSRQMKIDVAAVVKKVIESVVKWDDYMKCKDEKKMKKRLKRPAGDSQEMPAKRARLATPGDFPSPPPNSDEAMEVSISVPANQPTIADLTPPTTISPVPIARSSSSYQPKHSESPSGDEQRPATAPAGRLYPIFNLVRPTSRESANEAGPSTQQATVGQSTALVHTSTQFAIDFLTNRPQRGMPSPPPPENWREKEVKQEQIDHPTSSADPPQLLNAESVPPTLSPHLLIEQRPAPTQSPLVQPPVVQPAAPPRQIKEEPQEPEAPSSNPPLKMTIRRSALERATSAASTGTEGREPENTAQNEVPEPDPAPVVVPRREVKEEPMDEVPAAPAAVVPQSNGNAAPAVASGAAADNHDDAMEQTGAEDRVEDSTASEANVLPHQAPCTSSTQASTSLDHAYLSTPISHDHHYTTMAAASTDSATSSVAVGSSSSPAPSQPSLDLAPIPSYNALHGDVKEEQEDPMEEEDVSVTFELRAIERGDVASFLYGFKELTVGIEKRIAAARARDDLYDDGTADDDENNADAAFEGSEEPVIDAPSTSLIYRPAAEDDPYGDGTTAEGDEPDTADNIDEPSTSGINNSNGTANRTPTPVDENVKEAREGCNGKFPEEPGNDSPYDGPGPRFATPSSNRRNRSSLKKPKEERPSPRPLSQSPINWADEIEDKPEFRLRERRSRTAKPEPEGEKEKSEDEKFWTGKSESSHCPRCNDKVAQNSRRTHYQKYHYNILFAGEVRRMSCEDWMCWKLGTAGVEGSSCVLPSRQDDRVCLLCPPGSEMYRNRCDLIRHKKKEHKPEFKVMKEEYRLHSRERPVPIDSKPHMMMQ